MPIIVFTDGAATGNPGPGGWGAIVVAHDHHVHHVTELGGGSPHTTNNKMELSGVIAALQHVRSQPRPVAIYTDSTYVIQGITQWVWGWRKRGWKTASLATDTVIVYFRNVVQAFEKRFTQLGGKIATKETYQSLGGNPASWQNTVTRLNGEDADVIVTVTAAAFGAQVPIVNGLRTLGNNTPVLNSWAGDGNYWYTQEPKVTNYYYVTYASAFGNDPVKAVNALAKRNAAAIAKAGSTGAFVTGPAAIDGILLALKRTGGNTNGAALAAQMEKFKNVPTISGLVSFSKQLHSVFGRQYRVIRVENNTPRVVGTVKAKVVPKI